MSLLILLWKVPTEVKCSWGDTAKDIQNPRPPENQKKVRGKRRGENCHMDLVWTNGAYTRTEVSYQDWPVPAGFQLGRCNCISSGQQKLRGNVFKAGKGIIVCFTWSTVIRMKTQQAGHGGDMILSSAECFHPPKQSLGAAGTQKLVGSDSQLCRLLLPWP